MTFDIKAWNEFKDLFEHFSIINIIPNAIPLSRLSRAKSSQTYK